MKKIYPVIMNANFERLCTIDDYISLIWTTRYYGCGDFELCIDVTDKSTSMIQQGYYVMRDDDEHIGIVEDIKIQHAEDGADMIVVSGRFLSSIIGRRIIEKQTQLNGTISNCIYSLLQNEVINPIISARKISNFTYGTYSTKQKMQMQVTGKNLLETIEDICLTNGIGFKTTLMDDNKFLFQLFEGVDRSYNQNVNPYVVFSDVYENLASAEYEENYQEMVTNVLVAGEGEGLDRKTVWVTKSNPTGLNRYEAYRDARNTRTNDGEVSDAVYYDQLKQEGLEELTQFTQAFTGTVYFVGVEYGKDVNIGDICVIENSRWGIAVNSRLVEVIESVSEAGVYSIVPTFGL